MSDYRTWLTRTWPPHGNDKGRAVFVMLNPSTADQTVDDPTIRRCIGFAKREGYSGLIVVNLYALRATRPKHLWEHPDPVGRRWSVNDRFIAEALVEAARGDGRVIVAWGAHARPDRVQEFMDLADGEGISLWSLGVTQSGAPRHPLYVRGDQPLLPWSPR